MLSNKQPLMELMNVNSLVIHSPMSANVMLEEQRQLQDAQPEWSDMVGGTLPNIGRKAGEHKDNDTKTIKRHKRQFKPRMQRTRKTTNAMTTTTSAETPISTHSTENIGAHMELPPMSMNSHEISRNGWLWIPLQRLKTSFVLK